MDQVENIYLVNEIPLGENKCSYCVLLWITNCCLLLYFKIMLNEFYYGSNDMFLNKIWFWEKICDKRYPHAKKALVLPLFLRYLIVWGNFQAQNEGQAVQCTCSIMVVAQGQGTSRIVAFYNHLIRWLSTSYPIMKPTSQQCPLTLTISQLSISFSKLSR